MIRWICVPGSHSILRETEWETLVVVGIRLLQKWLDVELLGCNVLKEAVSIIILRNFCFSQKKELGGSWCFFGPLIEAVILQVLKGALYEVSDFAYKGCPQ